MSHYGQTANSNPIFDSNVYQGEGPFCAIRCQELILRDFGIQIPKQELVDYASENGWYSNFGTPRSQACNLLKECGIDMNVSYGNSVENLIQELSQGHRIMVSIDAEEMNSEFGSKEWEIHNSIDNARHVILVTGIHIDDFDASKSSIIITDPGSGMVNVECNLNHFVKAWEDSRCYMASSVEAAPYQYNPYTHVMEYSDSATDFSIHNFPFHNEFSDIWHIHAPQTEMPQDDGYTPTHEFSIFDQFRHHHGQDDSDYTTHNTLEDNNSHEAFDI